MIIYRLETDDTPGPCRDPELRAWWEPLEWRSERRDFYFGFASIEQLLEWFASPEFHAEAHDQGFRISEVEVSGEYRHGTYQSVFERSKSRILRRIAFHEVTTFH
jgi:hypothetical protein